MFYSIKQHFMCARLTNISSAAQLSIIQTSRQTATALAVAGQQLFEAHD
jgi:hypothetical protein